MVMIPLIQHVGSGSVIAYCEGRPVHAAQFLQDVASLAQTLPDKSYILNLCTNRYRFSVGFSAALLRGQISLLPPNYTQHFIDHLKESFPDMYCLADADTHFRGLDVMHYPTLPEVEDSVLQAPSIMSEQPAALVFTSGSTGQPVAHPKSWGSLCKGAVAEANNLGITQGSGLAVLGTVPSQHMYGLESSMLLAMQNGLAMVAERPFYPSDICAQLELLPRPRCLVTTPVHLRTLLSEEIKLPSVEFVLCATAHLSHQLAVDSEKRFAAPLYEIYGCTEAGQVASRRTAQGLMWHLLPGVGLRQSDEGSFVCGGHVEIEASLSDVIECHSDDSFILHGRTADMVNIAGKRTSLASLTYHLNEIPGVQDGVFFMPDEGSDAMVRPIAFVVAPGLSSAKIINTLRNSMDAVFLPRPVYFVEALPRSSTGKLMREALKQLLERCEKK